MGYINDENDFMHTKYSQSAKPAIGFKQLGADFDMDNKKIFRLNTQADVAIDADLDTYALDLSSGVNKGYVKRQCLTKDAQGNDFDLGQCNIFNSEPFYPGLYNDTSLPNVEYVRLEDNKVKAELNNKLADKADLSTNDEQTFNSIINVPNFNQGYSNMSNVMNKEYIDSRDALKTDKSYADNTYLKKITATAMAKSIQNKIDKTLADSTYLTKPVGSALAQSLQAKIDINGSKSMQADLNMDDHNITNLKEPINDTDDEYREGKRRLSAPSCSTPNPKRALLTTVGKTENGNSKEDGTQDCNSNPPCLNFEVPKLSDLPKECSKSWNDVELPVDFLLLTVEDCEFLGFFPYLEEPFKSYRKDIGYVWFGYMGSTVGSVKKLKIALLKCSKGSAVPGGSLTVVKNAVRVLRPKAVFSVGACSGLNRGKVKLGDVVVSSKLITPTHRTPASRDIGTLIRHAADGWNAPLANPDAMEVRVHCGGEVLSSPEVISEDIIQQYAEAIAVETEGEGVFAAAHDLKTEWVLIKGIKDYEDGSQPFSDEWGRFASVMAASVVANILSDPVVFEEWSHFSQDTSPAEPFDVKTCRSRLAEHYKRTATVPTSVWSKKSPVDIHQIYTRLSWVKEEQTPAGSLQSELSHYTDVFTADKDGVVPKRILVQGQTGIGKSTFVKKLAMDWAELDDEKTGDRQRVAVKRCENDENMIEDKEETSPDDEGTSSEDDEDTSSDSEYEDTTSDDEYENQKAALKNFELVLVINLKEVSKCPSFRDVVSRCNIVPEEETGLVEGLLNYITKNQEKVLLVFDGYDEYRCGRNSEIYEIFRGKKLRNCCVLITTRISKADELREFNDLHAEITGFSEKDRKAFMRRMLGGEAEVKKLSGHLSQRNLSDLTRVPLLLLFFCTLWKKGKIESIPKRKTKLYLAIVQYVLDYNQGKHSPSHFGKVEDFKEILSEIGKVALECLLKDDHVFEYDQLSTAILGDESLIVGLLQVTEYAENLRPAGMVSFIHKSIQEFLAAWYITYRCVPEGNLGGIEQHARTLKDCLALENVFQFICGLSDDGAVKVFQHLTSVRISDPTLDLSKIIPDVENETDVPLCDVTDRHKRFSYLVYDSFREVRCKPELLSHCFDCTGKVVLVTRDRPISKLVPKVNVLTELAQKCFFLFSCIPLNGYDKAMYESLELLDCLQIPLTIPESFCVFTVGNLMRKCQSSEGGYLPSFCSSILCFRNGQFQFYITELSLECDDLARLFTESSANSVPSGVARFCSEQSCLKFLRYLRCNELSGQTMKALGAVIRNCKHLNRIEVQHSDDSVCDLLEQVPNPSKCSLTIGNDEYYIHSGVCVILTSAGAVQLASLLPRFNNIITLVLDLSDCHSQAVDTLVTSITHKTLKSLILYGIRLSSKASAVLGRSLPEMSSLQKLALSGVDGSIVQAEEMEVLFGGFNKALPLRWLFFSLFSVRGCLAPLTKSFRFFPNLEMLHLGELNVDEENMRALLESLIRCTFTGNHLSVRLSGNSLRGVVFFAIVGDQPFGTTVRFLGGNCSEDGLSYVQGIFKQALPQVNFRVLK
ncbi:hypothetical protein ACROYT_G017068 [Oculina patagonica]